MTAPDLDLDARRRRARVRAWRRGLREMDLIMGGFFDAHGATLSADELAEFEALLDESDRDVFSWISGELPLPADRDGPVFRRITAFHTHQAPLFD